MLRLLYLAALVGSLVLVGGLRLTNAWGASFTVTKTSDSERGSCRVGDCSLREAIEAANTAGGTSTITLPAGTYTLTIRKTLSLSADITITGAGSTTTIVDGGQAIQVFDNPINTVEIDGVTVRRGHETSGVGGGGIHNAGTFTGSDLVLDSNSTTEQGGGLFNEGTAYLIQSVLKNNTAAMGGGLANTGNISFLGSFTINGNSSTAEGGGIQNDGFATLDNTDPPVPPGPATGGGTISSNTSGTSGGGIYNTSAISLMNVALEGNHATSDGAALWNLGSLDLLNGTISQSTAGGNGAGLWNDGSASLTNVTLAGNSTQTGRGGAIWNDANAFVESSTLAGNSASAGGGILNVSPGTVEVGNSILSANTPANCSGGIVSRGSNIDSGNSCTPTVSGDRANTDPLLGPLQYNAPGPTFLKTRAPLSGSPALDTAANCPPPATDERGVTRPQGQRCDVGAVEIARVAACGDVNGDGAVNIADALVVSQFDVGLRQCGTAPFAHPENCDVNQDGVCNIGDALRIAQCDVGLVSCTFTCRVFACP